MPNLTISSVTYYYHEILDFLTFPFHSISPHSEIIKWSETDKFNEAVEIFELVLYGSPSHCPPIVCIWEITYSILAWGFISYCWFFRRGEIGYISVVFFYLRGLYSEIDLFVMKCRYAPSPTKSTFHPLPLIERHVPLPPMSLQAPSERAVLWFLMTWASSRMIRRQWILKRVVVELVRFFFFCFTAAPLWNGTSSWNLI